MPDLNETYERKLRQHIQRTNNAIRELYIDGINELSITAGTITYKGIPFALKDYPLLKKKVEDLLKRLNFEVYTLAVNSIETSWNLSNQKNSLLIDQRLAGRKPSKAARKIIYDPNKRALTAYLERKENGLNLSDRVWRTLQPLRNELEQSLGFAIAKGEPAATTATQIKKYLNEPDKLFRRVRTDEGKLVLSPAARNYHPGRGVYRSSYKNALRLTRTENNMAYRTADYERWNNMPFVIGMEVKLSDAHPRYDICDRLAGKYPKEFLFRGWHAQCICFSVPVMASDKEFEKIEDAILAGQPVPKNIAGTITKPPAELNKWVKENKDRVAGWKNKPYWMQDNKSFL